MKRRRFIDKDYFARSRRGDQSGGYDQAFERMQKDCDLLGKYTSGRGHKRRYFSSCL